MGGTGTGWLAEGGVWLKMRETGAPIRRSHHLISTD